MSVSTITWSPSVQWGSASGPASTWVEIPFGTTTVLLDGTAGIERRAGAIFDASLDQTLRFGLGGHLLDGPIVLAFTLRALFTRPVDFEGGGPDNRVEAFFVPEHLPVNFADGALAPLNRGDVSLGVLTLNLPAPFAAQTVDFVFTAELATQARALITSRAFWSGRFAVSVRAVGANTIRMSNGEPGGDPLLLVTIQESLFFSGLAGGPSGKVRAVRDGRFGMPALNTELVRDGDNPGLWVRPFDWDPEDPEQTYRPRPGEGTVDDKIPNP